jgi:hypothetical protein
MKQAVEFEEMEEVDDVPVSAILKVQKRNPYGSIEGLNDDELADPDELERQVMAEEWGPVLMIPTKKGSSGIQPAIDESGGVDWGAFGTVDFERSRPEFDKARYKAEKLKEKRDDLIIMMQTVCGRLPRMAMRQVLKYVQSGIIELEDIASEDMRALAKLYLRTLRVQKEIRELDQASLRRRRAKAEAWLRSP